MRKVTDSDTSISHEDSRPSSKGQWLIQIIINSLALAGGCYWIYHGIWASKLGGHAWNSLPINGDYILHQHAIKTTVTRNIWQEVARGDILSYFSFKFIFVCVLIGSLERVVYRRYCKALDSNTKYMSYLIIGTVLAIGLGGFLCWLQNIIEFSGVLVYL